MKKLLINLSIIAVVCLIFFSCEDQPPTIYDGTPEVKINYPTNNSSVSDTILIQVSIKNIDAKRVELYIDHEFLAENVFEEPPYEYLWDCRWYQEGSQHIIQAKAYNKSGKVFQSEYVIVNVFRFMPSSLTAELISDSVIVLNWIDNCKYESGFEIEQAIDDSNFVKIAQLDSNSTSFMVNGIFSLNTKYLYRVRAFQNKNFSGYSNIVQAMLRLVEPSNLSAVMTTDTSAVFSWSDNNSFETGYVISKRNVNGAFIPIQFLPANSTNTIVNETFYLNQYYNYSIHAVRDFYQSSKAFFSAIFLTFPPPTELNFEHVSENSIELNWRDNSSFEKGFIVYRTDNGGFANEIARVSSNITEYIDQNIDTSNTYSYSVKAFTIANITLPSNTINVFFSKTIEVDKHIIVPYGISEAEVSNDFKIVAIGGYISNKVCIRVFDISDGTLINTFVGDSTDSFFWRIAISPDNKYVAACGDDYNMKIWDIVSGQLFKKIELGTTPNFIEYTSDGAYLIVEVNMHLRIYNTTDWTGTTWMDISDDPVYIAIDPNQTTIALGFWNSNLKTYDFPSGALKYEIPNTFRSTSVHYNEEGDKLYFHTIGNFKVWDVNNNLLIKTINNFGFPGSVDITSEGNLAICSGYALSLWDINKEIIIDNFLENKEFGEVKFSPDNTKLFTREFVNGYYIWDVVNRWVQLRSN